MSVPTINIICDGNKTLPRICELYRTSIQAVLQLNDQIRDTLVSLNLQGKKIPEGTVLVLPDCISLNYDLSRIYSTDYKDYTSGSLTGSQTSNQVNHSGVRSVGQSHDKYLSYFVVYHRGQATASYGIPSCPSEVSDTNSAQFSSVSLLGRSVDYQIYNGSGRTLSFNLNLHEEIFSDYKTLGNVVSALESACYPNYSGEDVLPPEIMFVILGSSDGSSGFKKIRGILDSFNAVWKPPIIDGRMVVCDLSISIKETTGPYSGSEVKAMKGIRGA